MYRQNLAQKRLYDDIDPSFGLNKRVRTNTAPVPHIVRQQLPVYNSDPGLSRHQNSNSNKEILLPFGPNSIQAPGPSVDSPYFNTRYHPMMTDRNLNPAPPTTPSQNKVISMAQQPIPGPSKPKGRNGIHILTGTVEKVLHWSKMTRNHRVLFEVLGKCDYVRQGSNPCEKVFVMRDSNSSPTIQVAFYEIDRPLIPLDPGSIVKVKGHMTSRSRLQAFSIEISDEEELNASQRIIYICDRAVHDLIN